MNGRIAVLGAGGHAKVVIDTAMAAGFEVAAVFDDDEHLWGSRVGGLRVEGPLEAVRQCRCDGAVIAIGDNRRRMSVAGRIEANWATVVHPSAWVCDSASLGAGTVVFANAVVQPEARVGAHVIVNTAATVDHDCEIGDFAHVAPGVRLGGEVRVGAGALLGIGSVVTPGVEVGAWSVVGAGSVVIDPVARSVTVAGAPARPLRS